MKRIKKMLALLLVLVLSFGLAMTTAYAADGLTITVGTASGVVGGTVTVPVTISNNPGILSAKLKFNFDSDQLELTGMANGEVFIGDTVLFEANCEAGTVILDNSTADDPVSSDGTLLTLTFQIKAEAAGSCPVTVTATQIIGSAISGIDAAVVDGEVTVVSGEGPSMEDVISKPDALPAENISFDGDTMTITPAENTPACVVLVKKADGSYERVPAVANAQGGYDFDVSAMPEGASIVVAVKGDLDNDGIIEASEAGQLKAAQLGKLATFTEFMTAVADFDGDGTIEASEAGQLKAAQLGKLKLSW